MSIPFGYFLAQIWPKNGFYFFSSWVHFCYLCLFGTPICVWRTRPRHARPYGSCPGGGDGACGGHFHVYLKTAAWPPTAAGSVCEILSLFVIKIRKKKSPLPEADSLPVGGFFSAGKKHARLTPERASPAGKLSGPRCARPTSRRRGSPVAACFLHGRPGAATPCGRSGCHPCRKFMRLTAESARDRYAFGTVCENT